MGEYGSIGHYEILGELGRGAMARVWRAWDPRLCREVAIKEPLFDERLSPAVRAELGRRFADEGVTAAKLQHPGIVTIYAADVWDGRPAIVMELVKGQTLADRLLQGPIAPAESLALLDQLLDAVGYAHSYGVVHRDIKPENIFITDEGRVKLADFGIARSNEPRSGRGTVMGSVLGTPGYMSPEQALGKPADARSDLFSVGVVAYEMLTGRNPFGASEGADTTTLGYRTVHEEVPELPLACTEGLPQDLRPAVAAALAKNPDERPQSAAEFRQMLHGQKTRVIPKTVYDGVGTNYLVDDDGGTGAARQDEPPVMDDVARATYPAHGDTSSKNASRSRRQAESDSAAAGWTGDSRGSSRSSDTRRNAWLPYVIVCAIALAVLGVVLKSAFTKSSPVPAQEGEQSQDADETDTQSTKQEQTYYLASHEGYVAIFSSDSDSPIEISDVKVSDLGTASASALAAHVDAGTYEEARKLLDGYRAEADEAISKREAAATTQDETQNSEEELMGSASAQPENARQVLYPQASGVNLREQPRHTSSLAGEAFYDDDLYWYGETGVGEGSDGIQHEWYYVTIAGTDVWGYVRSDLVSTNRPATGLSGRTTPFWGVWTYAAKDVGEAIAAAQEARSIGFERATVFFTTDWGNLNPEPWYVVCLGCEDSEGAANSLAYRAINAGYGDAYAKYSGNHY